MKILLVEDNVKLNQATKVYLEESGFEVEVAFNGVQAISKVKDLKKKEGLEYEIIILDRMMPMKDGIETLREIKGLGVSSGIIILTAKDTVEDKVFGLAAGADDYIIKPFNVKELIARIHAIYRRNFFQNTNKSNIYQNTENLNLEINNQKDTLHKYSFNVSSGEIILKNKNEKDVVVVLTNKEASIFQLLVSNNNLSVNKDLILEKIWQDSEVPNSRFVDVHVHNLRSKLLENNFPGKIETVRGIGYKLVFN